MLCWLGSALMELLCGAVQERQGGRQTTRSWENNTGVSDGRCALFCAVFLYRCVKLG
jgi:hypothetical protein